MGSVHFPNPLPKGTTPAAQMARVLQANSKGQPTQAPQATMAGDSRTLSAAAGLNSQISTLRTTLVTSLGAAKAHVTPEEFNASAMQTQGQLEDINRLSAAVSSGKLSPAAIADAQAKLANVGKPGGMAPEELSNYVSELTLRAKGNIPGAPGTAFPADKANLVASYNAAEAISNARARILSDVSTKALNVGKDGGMTSAEYSKFSTEAEARLKELDSDRDLALSGKLSSSQAADLEAKALAFGKIGGL